MKIETEKLAALLEATRGPCRRRTTMPILQCVHLGAKDGRLTAHATDIEAHIQVSAPCDGDLEPLCVNHPALERLVGHANGSITLNLDKTLKVQAIGKSALPVRPVDEFVEFPPVPTKALAVNAEDLALAIESVHPFCADASRARPALEHVFVRLSATSIETVATDGRTLAVFNKSAIAGNAEFMIVATHARLIASALRLDDAQMFIGEKFFHVQHADGCVAVLRTDYQRPKFQDFTTTTGGPFGDIRADAVARAAKICASFDIRCHVGMCADGFTISAKSAAAGEYSETIQTSNMNPATFCFDPALVAAAFERFGESKVKLWPVKEHLQIDGGDLKITLAACAK